MVWTRPDSIFVCDIFIAAENGSVTFKSQAKIQRLRFRH